jgi:pimeloyl-ACP methyl ester carboxylesterase
MPPPLSAAGPAFARIISPAVADEPVLLVHGFASSFARNWQEPGWVDLLEEEGRTVIGLDLLGHGTSAKPTDPEAYIGLERSVQEAMPDTGRVDAIGFSLGGRLLLRLAADEPERFRRIVIGGVGDSIFSASDPEPASQAILRGQPGPGDPPSAGAFARFAQAPGNDPAALAACMRRPSAPLTEKELAGADVPILIVLGDRDFAGPADRLLAALPQGRLAPVSGADHFGLPKDFRFIDAALEFLRV